MWPFHYTIISIPLLSTPTLIELHALEESFEPALELLASSLTHSQYTAWSMGDIPSNVLTTVYYVLFQLASCNWRPTDSLHYVSKKIDDILYKVRHKMDFHLGTIFRIL